MKPESQQFFAKARELIDRAPALLAAGFTDEAGRAAYFAGFHAAQALIFEKTDRILKTHNGVQAEFAKLIKDEAAVPANLRAFLARAYNLKAVADYESGPGSKVSAEKAAEAIASATRLLTCLEALLGG